jgi:uncharacterized membrane protein
VRISRLTTAGLLLGFALGGFFDGILLHQVLQWHHLLSAVEASWLDLRGQVVVDGLFHVATYALALVGLLLLVRSAPELAAAPSGRPLMAALLAGFAGWHIVDAVLSHWLLGIHRIRMDTAVPLAWDLGWLAVFGLVPLLAAWALSDRHGPPASPRRSAAAGVAIALTVVGAGAVAARPAGGDATIAVFPQGTGFAEIASAVDRAEARLRWSDPSGLVWALDLPPRGDVTPLRQQGAVVVDGGFTLFGCLPRSQP